MPGLVKDAPRPNLELLHGHAPRPRRHRLWRILSVIVVLIAAGFSVLAEEWPFTRAKIVADLEDSMRGAVTIGKFRRTYFPHPGCVAENVIFKGYGDLPNTVPITVRKLVVQGSYRGLLSKHIPLMRAEGVQVVAAGASAFAGWKSGRKPKATIDELVVAHSVLEFSHGAGTQPLRFEVAELSLSNPGGTGAMHFALAVRNPKPPGEVRASGSLGPWKADNPSQTPLEGTYTFRNANLGFFHGIAGMLSADGSFQGTVRQLNVRGKTETPDFQVTDTGHKMLLATDFQARVNTRNGDVLLEQVAVRLGRSDVSARGSVAGRKGEKGKTAALDLTLRKGRIQDFLYLFLNDPAPPMNGTFSFKGQARLPAGPGTFTERVELHGDFGVYDATLVNPATQGRLEGLSELAEGEKGDVPERVMTDLKGHVVLSQGTAIFSDLTFHVPGAKARLHGTYSLLTHRINLHGRLGTRARLFRATTGFKSFLLKIIDPWLRKNRHGGGVVELGVTGIYPHPNYQTTPITNR